MTIDELDSDRRRNRGDAWRRMIGVACAVAGLLWGGQLAAEAGESGEATESSELERAGDELKFRVIDRGGGTDGAGSGEEATERQTRSSPSASNDKRAGGDPAGENGASEEVSIETIRPSLRKPMRQQRWSAAEEALNEEGSRPPAEWFAAGWIAWNQERWLAAESRFSEAIERAAGLPDFSALYAARSAYKADRYHRAAMLAAKVSTGSSQYPKALYVLGESLNQLPTRTDRTSTIRVMRAYMRHFPRGPDADRALLVLGDALAERGEYESAAEQWETLLRKHPTSQWADEAHSRFEDHRGSLPEPYGEYAESLPRDLQMARWRGMYGDHQSEALLAEIRERIEGWTTGTTDRCQALYWLARSLTKLRRHGDAISWYDRVLGECDDVGSFERNALYMVGKSQWNAGQLDAALASFERLWREYPSHSFADDVMYFAARIHRERDDRKKMTSRLKTQLERYPKGDKAADARWLLVRGDFERDKWERIVDRVDGWSTGNELVGPELAENQYAAGRLAYAKARALVKLGERDRAEALYHDIAQAHPLSYYALMSLNRLAELRGESDGAGAAGDTGTENADAGVAGSSADAGGDGAASGAVDDLCAGALAAECESLVDGGRSVVFQTEAAGESLGPERLLNVPRRVTESRIFRTGHRLLAYGVMELAAEQFRELFEIHASDKDVLWGLAKLLDRAGAHSISHDIARRQVGHWKRAYPGGAFVEMWKIAYPTPFGEMVRRWSGRRGLSESLIWGLMREESGFAPAVGSWAGAVGLMQLMPDTAQRTARRLATGGEQIEVPDRAGLTNPAMNIQVGTGYLKELSDRLGGRTPLMIAGYNAGLGNVSRWLDARGDQPLDLWVEDIPYGQTRRYVKRVMASYWTYLWLKEDGGVVPVVE